MLPRFHFSIERWRKNKDYEVWVSNYGRIRLIKNKKELDPRIDQSGYCVVFTKRGVCRVHTLVALTWLGEKPNKDFTIDHISTNKRDNSVKNLRWVEHSVNSDYSQFTLLPNKLIKVATNAPTKAIQSVTKSITLNEDEQKLVESMTDGNIPLSQRVNTFRRYLLNEKISIVCDGREITTFKELYDVKNKHASQATNDDFLNRLLMSTKSEKSYCGHKWKIKVNHNG